MSESKERLCQDLSVKSTIEEWYAFAAAAS